MFERRQLPALDRAKPLKNPDLFDIGNKNYTDTILKYGGLATRFTQLETEAKTIVEAINEINAKSWALGDYININGDPDEHFGFNSLVIGYNSAATNDRGVALGTESRAYGEDVKIIGSNNKVGSSNNVGQYVIGSNNKAIFTAYDVNTSNYIFGDQNKLLNSSVVTQDSKIKFGYVSNGRVYSDEKLQKPIYLSADEYIYDILTGNRYKYTGGQLTSTQDLNNGASRVFVAASSCNISGGTSNVIFGLNHTLTEGRCNFVTGYKNELTSGSYATVTGFTNKITNSNYSSIFGKNNEIKASNAAPTNISSVLVNGDGNKLTALYSNSKIENSLVNGGANVITLSSGKEILCSLISGTQHNLTSNISYSEVLGSGVTTSSASSLSDSLVCGNALSLSRFVDSSIICGKNMNLLSSAESSLVLGSIQSGAEMTSSATNSIVFGAGTYGVVASNSIINVADTVTSFVEGTAQHSIIFGGWITNHAKEGSRDIPFNRSLLITDKFICGSTMSVAGFTNSIVMGNNIEIPGPISDSIILGDNPAIVSEDQYLQNTVIGGGTAYNFVIGCGGTTSVISTDVSRQQSLQGGSYNIVSGRMNQINGGSYNIVSGLEHTVSGGYQCAVFGSGNSINGCGNSLIDGLLNTASGCNQTIVSGSSNNAGGCNQCIVSGTNNSPGGCSNSLIIGNHHTGSSYANAIISGYYSLTQSTKAFIIGNGTSSTASNAFTVGFDGEVYAQGDYYSGVDKLATVPSTLPVFIEIDRNPQHHRWELTGATTFTDIYNYSLSGKQVFVELPWSSASWGGGYQRIALTGRQGNSSTSGTFRFVEIGYNSATQLITLVVEISKQEGSDEVTVNVYEGYISGTFNPMWS